jgi:hypothetical protein
MSLTSLIMGLPRDQGSVNMYGHRSAMLSFLDFIVAFSIEFHLLGL